MKQILKRRLTSLAIVIAIGCLLISQGGTVVQSTPLNEPAPPEAPMNEPVIEDADEATGEVTEVADLQEEMSPDEDIAVSRDQVPQGMQAMAENEALTLYVHPETTKMAVLHKSSGAIWHSNPPDGEADAVATGYNKAKLNVQFELTYFDESGNALRYDNYTHSVLNEQFEIEQVEDGVNLVYTLGEVTGDLDAIPKYISAERFQSVILDRIASDADKREVERRFRYDEEQQRYERRDTSLRGVGLPKVLGIFEEIGYNEAERAIDKESYGESADGPLGVRVPLSYRLEGEELLVSISGEGLEYPDSMNVQAVSLLPFFGASGREDEGYMLVPDGSGSIIRFNNGRTYASPFRTSLYGSDAAINQLVNRQQAQVARLPVFGISYHDRGLLAVIEQGDAVSAVEADISGRLNEYNTVYPIFTLHNFEEVTLTNGWRSSTIKRFQKEPFRGDIAVRYQFLEEGRHDYPAMAARYREYLIRTAGLTPLDDKDEMPFYVQLIGGIPKQKFFLGIPYFAYEPLTTFDQASIILDQMKNEGIGNIKLRYTGWFNNGIHHNLPSSIKVDKGLGGTRGLNTLKGYTEANGVSLFPDVTFLETAPGAKGLKRSSQASRFITGKIAAVYPYHAATYMQNDEGEPGYVVSPKALPEIVEGFRHDYAKLGLSGLSLRDLGNELNADYNREGVIDREEAKGIAREQLAGLGQAVPELMIEGGNSYAASYARHIVDAPMSGSGFNIADESVPFFQLVLHGYANYAGTAWNLADNQDTRQNFLKALETGAALYYTWFYADASTIKMTGFDHFYSADYRSWLGEAADHYAELNDALGDVAHQTIADHRKLAEGVYKTTYEEGKTVIVNYNDTAVQVEGVTVGAMDYRMGGGGRQ